MKKDYLYEVLRNNYFNYYIIGSSDLTSDKLVKECRKGVISTEDAFNEYKDLTSYNKRLLNPSVMMKTRCMFLEPYNYATYQKKDYPYNYCFTGGLSGGWKALKHANDWAWLGVDFVVTSVAGGFTLGIAAPFVYAGFGAATAVGQEMLDSVIISHNKWPQPKTSEDQ